ncbi:MAG: hypothetical protein Fur0041_19160 [Bacteroidia bacterium]
MKQLTLSFLLLLSFLTLSSQTATKTTVASGQWNDPNIWFPSGVPNISTDTIIINHQVGLTDYTSVNGKNLLHISASGCLYSISGLDTFATNGFDLITIIDGGLNVYHYTAAGVKTIINGVVHASSKMSVMDSLYVNLSGRIIC